MRDAIEAGGGEAAAAEEESEIVVAEKLDGFAPSNGETPQHGLVNG